MMSYLPATAILPANPSQPGSPLDAVFCTPGDHMPAGKYCCYAGVLGRVQDTPCSGPVQAVGQAGTAAGGAVANAVIPQSVQHIFNELNSGTFWKGIGLILVAGILILFGAVTWLQKQPQVQQTEKEAAIA